VQKLFKLTIKEAHSSDDNIIKILAVLDKRTGKRTLQKMKDSGAYLNYPQWVQDFYKIRFDAEGI
jgi:phage gp16-like protein